MSLALNEKKSSYTLYSSIALKLLKLNTPEWRWIILGVTVAIISGVTGTILPLFIAQIYESFDDPDVNKQKRLSLIYALCMFAIGVTAGLCDFSSCFGFAKSGEALIMRMRHLSFAALLRQEISYFDYEANSVAALTTRLISDASALKVNLNQSTES